MEKELARAQRFGRPLSLIFFDGDRFKRVNDTYGHGVGDVVLCEFGERAGSVLRGGDTLGRFGGEEFVILLHDIGKIGIPDALLQKRDRLSPAERAIIKRHPEVGAQLLETTPFLQELMPAIRHHHEWWDGKGYPDGLVGQNIPLEARIIAVAEAYDAMVTERPYQARRTSSEALAELQRCAGTQFDPDVVRAASLVLADQAEPSETRQMIGVLDT